LCGEGGLLASRCPKREMERKISEVLVLPQY
jgi:hypothetical protein